MRPFTSFPIVVAAVLLLAVAITSLVFGQLRPGDFDWQITNPEEVVVAEGIWGLRALTVDGKTLNPLTGTHPVTLRFKQGQIVGSGGCSSFTTFYGLDGDSLRLSLLSVSPAPCDNADAEVVEASFFAGLERVDNIGWTDDVLSFYSEDVILTFDRVE